MLKADKKKRKLDPMHDVRMRKDHPDNRERAQVEDEDDDAEWYRREVGEEPEEGARHLLSSLLLCLQVGSSICKADSENSR